MISHIFENRQSALKELDIHHDYYYIKATGKNAKQPKVVKWIYKKIIYTEEEKKELEKSSIVVNKMFQKLLIEHARMEDKKLW